MDGIDEDAIFKTLGLLPATALVRIDMHSGGLMLFIPKVLREKLGLKGERNLIGFCPGNYLLLVKDDLLEQALRSKIIDACAKVTKLRKQAAMNTAIGIEAKE